MVTKGFFFETGPQPRVLPLFNKGHSFHISFIMARTSLTPDKLLELIDPKNPVLLKEMGGASGLALSLNSNIEKV